MTLKLTFRISFNSDYHISAGYGKGSTLDSALQRDADGMPVMRGTSIVGLLRSELNQLAETEPFQASKQWQERWQAFQKAVSHRGQTDNQRSLEAADLLLGAPWHRKEWQISSARPVGMAAPQPRGNELASAGGHVTARVRVHPAQRRAEPRKLFFREEGDRKIQFEFTASCAVLSDNTLADALLLTAAARMVDGLGAGRRRGRGNCNVHLHTVQGWLTAGKQTPTEKNLLDLFEAFWLNNETLEAGSFDDNHDNDFKPIAPSHSGCRKLLILRTDEPVLVSKRAATGNQFDGLEFIPGFVIRGALAGLIAERFDLSKSETAVYQEFTKLFFRNALQIGPLYPTFSDGSRFYPTIPAPQDLFISELHPKRKQLKVEGQPILNGSAAAQCDFKYQSNGTAQKIDPLKGFLAVHHEAPIVRAKRSSEMHVTMNEQTGRAQDQELFGYSVLDVGQYFMTEIAFADESDWQNLQTLAALPASLPTNTSMAGQPSEPFTLRIGKGNRRGYGKVTCTLISLPLDSPTLWAAEPISTRVLSVDSPITLTLISDAIVLDAWGRSQQGFDTNWLSEALQLNDADAVKIAISEETGKSGLPHLLSFARSQMIDTFANHVGLPRTRDIALSAGSAVTWQIGPGHNLTLEALQKKLEAIEHAGIGMCTGEGFGRIVFNHSIYQDACANLNASGIKIPAAIAYAEAALTDAWMQNGLNLNLSTLSADLHKSLPKSPAKRENFRALVRELHGGQWQDYKAAKDVLDNYGEPLDLLGKNMPGRQKPNFFKNEGKSCLDVLRNALAQVNEVSKDDANSWQVGCRQVAEWLGEALDLEEVN